MYTIRNKPLKLSMLLFSATLAACAQSPFTSVEKTVYQRTGQHITWNTGTADDQATTIALQRLLTSDLTLEESLQISFLNNAQLQATYEDLGIAQADLVRAGLLQNPVLSLEMRFPGRPHFPVGINIEQQFLDIFFLPLKKKIAQASLDQAQATVTDAVLRHAAEVLTTYYQLQAANQLVALRKTILDAAQASLETTQRLRDAGNVTALAVDNEAGLLADARLALNQTQADAAEARENLNQLMGLWGKNAAAWSISARLPELPEKEIPFEGLESRAIAQRQDLLALQSAALAAAHTAGLADSAAFLSGVTLGADYQRDVDVKSTLGPTVSVPLPIFDQGQSAKARAAAQFRQSQDRTIALAVQIRAEVRRAYNRMTSARERAADYKQTVIPLRQRIVEQTQLQYNGMFVGASTLLLAKQDEIRAAAEYVQALRDYWLARTQLQSAIGGPLPDEPPAQPSNIRTAP